MSRAATTSDVFNAVAESRRRDILSFLAMEERPVGDIVAALELEQPSVSKHLRVLRDVGLVHARRDGRRILYRTNAEAIRPLNEWAATFERYWKHQLNRVKEIAEKSVGPGAKVGHATELGKTTPLEQTRPLEQATPDLKSSDTKPKEKK